MYLSKNEELALTPVFEASDCHVDSLYEKGTFLILQWRRTGV